MSRRRGKVVVYREPEGLLMPLIDLGFTVLTRYPLPSFGLIAWILFVLFSGG